jgi:uncharacterized protein (DUF1330 family)
MGRMTRDRAANAALLAGAVHSSRQDLNMAELEVSTAALDAAAGAVPEGQPIAMVNLVRFRDQAAYPPGSPHTPCTGREAYFERYRAAFGAVMRGKGVQPLFVAEAKGVLVGEPGEAWDAVAVVQYPNLQVLRAMLNDPAYDEQAAPHRRAALADWRFVLTSA